MTIDEILTHLGNYYEQGIIMPEECIKEIFGCLEELKQLRDKVAIPGTEYIKKLDIDNCSSVRGCDKHYYCYGICSECDKYGISYKEVMNLPVYMMKAGEFSE